MIVNLYMNYIIHLNCKILQFSNIQKVQNYNLDKLVIEDNDSVFEILSTQLWNETIWINYSDTIYELYANDNFLYESLFTY